MKIFNAKLGMSFWKDFNLEAGQLHGIHIILASQHVTEVVMNS